MRYELLLPVHILLSILVITKSEVSVEDRISTDYNKLFYKSSDDGDNNVFSPFNVQLFLSLLYQAASGNTAEILEHHLNATDKLTNAENYKLMLAELKEAKNVTATLSNKIFVDIPYEIQDTYAEIAKNYFSTGVAYVDLMTYWNIEIGSRKTNDKVMQSISLINLEESKIVVISNAFSFQAKWLKPFTHFTTVNFSMPDHSNALPTVLLSRQDYYLYAEHEKLDARIVKIPYADDRFNLVIVLPNTVGGIDDLETNLMNENMSSILDDSRMSKKLLLLHLPKFIHKNKKQLRRPLTKMGLWKIFSYSTDFSNIITINDTMKFHSFVQSTSFAVTEGEIPSGGLKDERLIPTDGALTFMIDHPFMFYVTVDFKTINVNNNILFMGKMILSETWDAAQVEERAAVEEEVKEVVDEDDAEDDDDEYPENSYKFLDLVYTML